MIQIFNLYKTYKGNTQALIDISFEIKSGEFVFLTGQSGAGKSTLLKILYRWEEFDKGQILINGRNISKIQEDNLYILRRNIGIVFQDYRLLPRKTVLDNICFAQEVVESPTDRIKYKAWEALKKVGLTQKKDSFPPQLSGGEQQRVAIARSLVNSPEILLADEPTGNLDPEIALEILKLFEHANRQGVTIIFATHSEKIIKAKNCRIISLSKGRLISS